MTKHIFCSLLVLLGLALEATSRAEIVVRDDANQRIALSAPARRIVSLAPHATELLFAAGAGDRVVGVSAFSDFPAAARRLPRVSGGLRLDMERILALQPDLVVGWQSGNARADLEKLTGLGIPVFLAGPQRLDALPDTLLRLARLADSERTARAAADRYVSELAALRDRYRDRARVTVFLEIEKQPLMTLSQAHLASDVLNICGGTNIVSPSELLAPEVSVEAVVLRQPDAILFSDELGTETEVRAWWQARTQIPAVRHRRIYAIPGDLVLRQSPRILLGIQRTCQVLDTVRESLARESH